MYSVLFRSTAKQVKLTDVLPAESTLVDGTLDASLGKIAMGSQAKHSYVIVFNTGSIEVTLPDATVTYQAEDESSDLTVSICLCFWGGWAPGGARLGGSWSQKCNMFDQTLLLPRQHVDQTLLLSLPCFRMQEGASSAMTIYVMTPAQQLQRFALQAVRAVAARWACKCSPGYQ